jgi:hypothetical protein
MKMRSWEFDSHSREHWAELAAGKVEKTKSWVEVKELPEDNPDEGDYQLTVFQNCEKHLEIVAYRDQWGTYISVGIRGDDTAVGTWFTIAQEDGTRSFVDALIAGLTAIKPITDIKTKPPTEIGTD